MVISGMLFFEWLLSNPLTPMPQSKQLQKNQQRKNWPLPELSLSKEREREPLEEKAESTDETPESRLSLEASLDSEELRLSSSGPSIVCEIPESSWDNNSERL